LRAVLIFVVVVLAVFVFVRVNGDDSDSSVRNEAALTWTLHAIGSLMAATAAFALLLRALASETLERQFELVPPLLAGVLLLSTHWSVALALAAVGVALIVKQILGRATIPPKEGA
jgi:hypothetical protein